MQSPKANSFSVVYDIEKNKYYRVNKETGQFTPSSKTGKTPPKFNPDITGKDYQARFNRFTHFNTINHDQRDSIKGQQNYQSINHDEPSNNILPTKNVAAFDTEPMLSKLSQKRDLEKGMFSRNKVLKSTVQNNQMHEAIQTRRAQRVKTLESEKVTLPKLQKKNSQSRIGTKNGSSVHQFKGVNPILGKLRDSQNSVDTSFVSIRTKVNPRDQSFAESMNRLTVASGENSISQSRMNWEKFESNLRRYCEIQENKLLENHFSLPSNKEINQKLKKFTAQKSLLTSILDESNFSLNPVDNKSRIDHYERKAITRTQVQKSLDTLSKEKTSLMLLSKKCQVQKNIPSFRDKNQQKKQSQPLIKAVDLKEIEEQTKLKSQLHQQKEKFLSFYPGYAFKQNPRLIKEQKDRKINLKKLQMLFLENNEKKFGRIYCSESKEKIA